MPHKRRLVSGDKYGRELILDWDTSAVQVLNDNLTKTIDQLRKVEIRQGVDGRASAVARLKTGKAKGQKHLPTTLVQTALQAGTEVVIGDAPGNTIERYVLARGCDVGDTYIVLTKGLVHPLSKDAPIYVADSDPLGLAERITLLENAKPRTTKSGATTADFLSLRESVDELQTLVGVIENRHSTLIEQTAKQISLVARRTAVDEFGRLTDSLEAGIRLNADRIAITASRLTQAEHSVTQAHAGITVAADRIQQFVKRYYEEQAVWKKHSAELTISSDMIRTSVEMLENIRGTMSRQYAQLSVTAGLIHQQVSWEDFVEFDGASRFTGLAAPLEIGHTTLQLDDIPTRLRPGDVIGIRNEDATLAKHEWAYFEVTVGGSVDIPASSVPVTIPIAASVGAAVVDSPAYLRDSFYTSIKRQTAYEISQSVIASQRTATVSPGTTSAYTEGVAVTSLAVTATTAEIAHGDTLILFDESEVDEIQAWRVTVNLPGGATDPPLAIGTTTIPIASWTPAVTAPTALPVYASTTNLQSDIIQLADQITLQVYSSSPFFIAEIKAGEVYTSGTPITQIKLKAAPPYALADGETLLITSAAGVVQAVTVNGAHTTSDTIIAIDSAGINAEAGDPVTVGNLTAINLELDGIDFAGPGINSANWNGAFHATDGSITTLGSIGWAISKQGESVFNNVWIRSGMSSANWDGQWDANRKNFLMDVDVDQNPIEGTEYIGTVGWAIGQDGKTVFTDAILRGDLDIRTTGDTVQLNTGGLTVVDDTYGTASLKPATGMVLPIAPDNSYYERPLISFTNNPGVAATARAHVGAVKQGTSPNETFHLNLIVHDPDGNVEKKIYTPNDMTVDGVFHTAGVDFPATGPANADYMLRSLSGTTTEWRDMNLERVYDMAIHRVGVLQNNETFFNYNAPRSFVVQQIRVSAGVWGGATVTVAGQPFTEGAPSWVPGTPPTLSSISGVVTGTAGGLANVSVDVKAYWV